MCTKPKRVGEREMEKSVATLDDGTTCSSWNYSGQRLATGSTVGTLAIFDSVDPSSSSFICTSRCRVHEVGIVKVVWVPPEYGDAVACICADGTLSLWEEVVEDTKPLQWKLCKDFEKSSNQVLDVQLGVSLTSLKLVAAYSNGHVKVYELLDPLELKNWQLQAEFQNAIDSVSKFGKAACLSASVSLIPQRVESPKLSFVLGFNSNITQLNSSKVWEFDQDHQRWLPVAELALPEEEGDPVYAVAWAPNIGRPYEVIAIATHKGIAIWHLGLNPDLDGRLSVEKVALLSGYEGEKVWEMEWDMSGMTLATTGSDGMVRLWQSNFNGVWHEQAAFEPTI
ncbi:epoxide hydrolase, soluble (sEH) [Sarracenia purpurea var. burkii]